MPLPRRSGSFVAAAALAALLVPAAATAQSLRGSRASIDRMYYQALAEDYTFFETPASVRRQVSAGRLVELEPNADFTMYRVGYPYVRRETRTFVHRLAAQYRSACGEQLVVTSAVRPATRQPANSADRSVHPTGMAIDLRKPQDATCRRWLRDVLLDLERARVIEATEEYGPPHFHVAVYSTPYRRYVAARGGGEQRSEVASGAADSAPGEARRVVASGGAVPEATYKVRPGDTLWGIARAHDTTVDVITRLNGLSGARIRPGQELRIPAGT